MNRNFYFFGIFLLALSMACGLLHSTIQLLIGNQILFFTAFLPWFLLTNIISLATAIFILSYYYHNKFTLALSTGTFSALAGLFLFIIIGLQLMVKGMESYYLPALIFTLTAAMVYALGLIFSSAAHRPWLKAAGISSFFISLALLSILLINSYTRDTPLKATLDNFDQWISFASIFIPGLFIMNFLSEVKLLKPADTNPGSRESSESLWGVGMLIFIFTLIFGVLLVKESYSLKYWQNRNAENTRQFSQLCESRTFTPSRGQVLHYLLMKPTNYTPQKKYPLVIALPYNDYEASAAQWLASDINRKKYPAFIFVPYCPPGTGWGGIPNYPAVDTLVFDALLALQREVSVDAKRVYITGVSKGGYGSWHFISIHPEMFAAAIPVCGAGDPRFAPKITRVSIWAFHGEKDKNVPVNGSRDMIDAIRKAGGNPAYTEFTGEGHNIWDRVTLTPGLLDWLFSQKRN